jgi:hypothetical protein
MRPGRYGRPLCSSLQNRDLQSSSTPRGFEIFLNSVLVRWQHMTRSWDAQTVPDPSRTLQTALQTLCPPGLTRGSKSIDSLGNERSRGSRFSSYFVGGYTQYRFDSASVLSSMSTFSPTVLRVLGLGTLWNHSRRASGKLHRASEQYEYCPVLWCDLEYSRVCEIASLDSDTLKPKRYYIHIRKQLGIGP